MKKNKKLAGIIAAGGSSSRYGKRNKLLDSLEGVPVFIYCVREMVQACKESQLVMVCPNDDIKLFKELVDKHIGKCGLQVISGGGNRMESVWNGLSVLDRDTDYVAVQDAARPFVTQYLIDDLVNYAEKYGASVPAKRVTDTLKMGNSQNLIEKTVDRSVLWSVQTPQVCRYSILIDAYEKAFKADKWFTDDAGVLEFCGQQVYLYEYVENNIKITYEDDLLWAETYIKHHNNMKTKEN